MSELFQDEIGAIEAIYPDLVTVISPQVYDFQVPQHEAVKLRMEFPTGYPEQIPVIKNVSFNDYTDPGLEKVCRDSLQSVFSPGDVCIFDLFTELDGVLADLEETDDKYRPRDDDGDELLAKEVAGMELEEDLANIPESHAEETVFSYDEVYEYNPDDWKWDDKKNNKESRGSREESKEFRWTISEPIVDRKSTFIAFVHEVHSDEDVARCFYELTQDKKIARANHLMRAWRIKLDSGAIIHDCDDDGETAAGSRLLTLLTVMDVWNVFVVVGRWFGGLHIGPDRFRHINSSAREAIVKAGYLEDRTPKKKGRKK